MAVEMNVHGWKACQYISGEMTISLQFGEWVWLCGDCGDHSVTNSSTSEEAMKKADAHRGKCHAQKKSA